MARYLEVEVNGETLTMEYNRNAIIKMEDMGFTIEKTHEKLLTSFEQMVYGALIKNHPDKKWSDVVEIAGYLSKEYGLQQVETLLGELYADALHVEGESGKKLELKGTKATVQA